MRQILFTLLATTLMCVGSLANADKKHDEKWHVDKYCSDDKEHYLFDRTRVDCLGDDYAIEYDFGEKWAECVGQALHYAELTGRHPGCALIDIKDGKFAYQIRRVRYHLPLPAGIWVVDDDSIKRIQ